MTTERAETCHTDEVVDLDGYGWALDEYGNQYGHCNSCGEEAPAYSECCEDGEVVPYGY